MLKLIRALSEYNGPTYDGAVMARAVIKASALENGNYSTRPVKNGAAAHGHYRGL